MHIAKEVQKRQKGRRHVIHSTAHPTASRPCRGIVIGVGSCERGRVNVTECNAVNTDVSSDDIRVVISDRLSLFPKRD